MTEESKPHLDGETAARIAELQDMVRKSQEQLALDRETVAKSRQIVKDSEKRLRKLREPESGEDAGTSNS